jgi:hypothetical protein
VQIPFDFGPATGPITDSVAVTSSDSRCIDLDPIVECESSVLSCEPVVVCELIECEPIECEPVHGCCTFEDFLNELDDDYLLYAEEDLGELCSSIRKEILVITKLQTRFLDEGQEARADDMGPRVRARQWELVSAETMQKTTSMVKLRRQANLHAS